MIAVALRVVQKAAQEQGGLKRLMLTVPEGSLPAHARVLNLRNGA